MSELVIRFEVSDDGQPGSLICFEYGGKRWCAYYIEAVEFVEAELREAGFPEHVIKFIINFLVWQDRVDIPELDEDVEIPDPLEEEDWII